MSKENRIKSFWQTKGIYILLLVASLVIITVAIVLAATSAGRETTLDNGSKQSSVNEGATQIPASSDVTSASDSGSSTPPSGEQTSVPEEDVPTPTVKEVYFIMPVENGRCIKEYTEASVVYNKTLGVYTGHMGMDITGDEGARVLCAYDGKITAIESGYLTGTTITVEHGNGLKTRYNSVDANENISVGDTVKQGDELGVISVNNRQEYKDGAHLHFEVEENGVKVSPTKYFNGYDK